MHDSKNRRKACSILLFLGLFMLNAFPVKSELIEYLATYKINVGEKTHKVKMLIVIPQSIESVQKIISIKCTGPNASIIESNGNQYAEFVIDTVKGDISIAVSVLVEPYKHDFTTVKKGTSVSFGLPGNFLHAEKYIEKDSSEITSRSSSFLRKDTLKTIKNIYNYVINALTYKSDYVGQKGAVKALQESSGDCTEFTDLFVAFCRSCNIPAIAAYGYVTHYSESPRHSWAEVYCPPYGWFQVDPTPGNQNTFKRLNSTYIQLSSTRNDENLGDGFFYRYTYWGDPIKIVENIKMRTFKGVASL